jgi:23S rRNA (uracil1939-C5)-methyltransferase
VEGGFDVSARRRARSAPVLAIADVTDLSHEGRGIAHIDGKTVFIDDALPGERVELRIVNRTRTFDEAQLVQVIQPSDMRTEARCAHFGICGGCALQHFAPQGQIAFKQRQLLEAFTRIGKVEPQRVLEPLSAEVWNYRRKARLAARYVPKKQRTVVGFRERSTSFITDVKRCDVLVAPMDRLVEPLSLLVTQLSIRDRVPQIEVAVADNAVALVVRILEPLTDADRELLLSFAREHSVDLYVQPGGYDTVAPLSPAPKALEYRLAEFDVTLNFLPADFVQVNARLNEMMIARAIELLQPQASDRVLDLFCGIGNFSLPLARRSGHVTGVEGDQALIARARENATRNAINNADFFAANLMGEDFVSAPWALRKYDRVLLDPPRAGAREVLPVIAKANAHTIVYVSCHPASLARDAGLLVNEYGFKLDSAGVMDMFPHTAHVESIALFTKARRT